jgi:hypothetical protein
MKRRSRIRRTRRSRRSQRSRTRRSRIRKSRIRRSRRSNKQTLIPKSIINKYLNKNNWDIDINILDKLISEGLTKKQKDQLIDCTEDNLYQLMMDIKHYSAAGYTIEEKKIFQKINVPLHKEALKKLKNLTI